ncbi:hypothetical protein RRG08_030733 [Elysia crispata]|uniref:Uncharacterized protein n=1 Tax=Elysia crispata TaxID=231223 RepID=A0AAE1CSY9_9GAST|nr:hypothetical protein RRG08_030733 [Elysia crispata]
MPAFIVEARPKYYYLLVVLLSNILLICILVFGRVPTYQVGKVDHIVPRRAVVFAPVFIFVLIVGVNYYMPLLFSFLRRMATMTEAQKYVSGTASMAFVTVPNMEVAKKLAGDLVKKRLAACVNIIPGVTSVYEWEGKIEDDNELILMIKTLTTKVDELSEFVRNNHPYDCAEVISSQIDNGNAPYLQWISQTVLKEPEQKKFSLQILRNIVEGHLIKIIFLYTM